MSSRKKLDSRIPSLIANGVANNHRSFFVVVGDRGRDQVVNLHYFLSKARVTARPSVLWCYKKELNFSSNRKSRMKKIKRQIAQGTREADEEG
jgi:N-acetyltransferase 10